MEQQSTRTYAIPSVNELASWSCTTQKPSIRDSASAKHIFIPKEVFRACGVGMTGCKLSFLQKLQFSFDPFPPRRCHVLLQPVSRQPAWIMVTDTEYNCPEPQSRRPPSAIISVTIAPRLESWCDIVLGFRFPRAPERL